jgi:hypothetical protein
MEETSSLCASWGYRELLHFHFFIGLAPFRRDFNYRFASLSNKTEYEHDTSNNLFKQFLFIINRNVMFPHMLIKKVTISLLQALEAPRVARG